MLTALIIIAVVAFVSAVVKGGFKLVATEQAKPRNKDGSYKDGDHWFFGNGKDYDPGASGGI